MRGPRCSHGRRHTRVNKECRVSLELNRMLQIAIQGGASDIHIKVGLPPMFRVNGMLLPLKDAERMSPEDTANFAKQIMTPGQLSKFREKLDLDLAYGVPGLGRFRVNAFVQRGSVGLVFRVIPFKVQTIKDLLLPASVAAVADSQRGLILVTGATGSGKSTTLAAMIEHINSTRTAHIITIEDPIEFLIRDKRCIINQREVGADARSFSQALRAALRQDPDVILVGEMRDLESMEIAITAAETGHLVLSTLHTVDAAESITRILSAFPQPQQRQVRMQLANLLKGVVSQRLVPRADTAGRVPAVEVMVSTGQIRELILNEAQPREITEAIAKGHQQWGSQTFDQSLMALLANGYIAYEEALTQSSNPDDFALRYSGIESTESQQSWQDFAKKDDNSKDEDDLFADDFEIDRF
ncbi:MAG: type IV pili twitching motility protein PilT [Deltaproteobacteria bacterium CG_4_9_14_3_um_filter_63_12]|nr:MAG: type IV pili twitching motility protein PilT [Deltaproteobacteria bacterium CG17_big_fil_post_rev_8_21_14_2_50_63_7]PJB37319.1 MAG: type IV pili twitching motility protein PilT [Deltaproteobacteria bacterium CG_4_9_14_3_um_filter_63_12]